MEFYGHKYNPDTVLYFYNEQNQIDRTIHSYLSNREYNNYHFDEKGNLNYITSETYWNDYLGNSQKVYIDTSWFIDYDTAPNLAKKLIIFEECYYRALSTNNFRKYIKKRYSVSDTILQSIEQRSWDLLYDENNYPIY